MGESMCGGCFSRQYCSPRCQKIDWDEHCYSCCPKAPPLAFDGLRKTRPKVSSSDEFEALIDEIKRTYYLGAVPTTADSESQTKNGVDQGYITIKAG